MFVELLKQFLFVKIVLFNRSSTTSLTIHLVTLNKASLGDKPLCPKTMKQLLTHFERLLVLLKSRIVFAKMFQGSGCSKTFRRTCLWYNFDFHIAFDKNQWNIASCNNFSLDYPRSWKITAKDSISAAVVVQFWLIFLVVCNSKNQDTKNHVYAVLAKVEKLFFTVRKYIRHFCNCPQSSLLSIYRLVK